MLVGTGSIAKGGLTKCALGILFIPYLVEHLFLTFMHECYQSPWD